MLQRENEWVEQSGGYSIGHDDQTNDPVRRGR